MITKSRKLILDIFDYSGNNICTLYDNNTQSTGQAEDIFVTTERNGWKELSFNIPYKIHTENGEEDNYRLQLLQSDYKIRLIDDEGIDWFIITKPSFAHKGKNKTVSVTAAHIAQLLKIKNLGLEFSDEKGNNVGTAKELLTTILDGTGWKPGEVIEFLEDDKTTIKKRSLKANSKTGAFKLITQMCDLFEAKPVFHGNERTVDILPMNPFSETKEGELPDVTKADGVAELHYSKNIKNVTRSSNSENLVTKLYAYGSYGDKVKGYCDIKECIHKEYVFTLTQQLNVSQSKNYYFSITDESGTIINRSFEIDRNIPAGSEIIYSMLDPASQMYVWIQTKQDDVFDDFLKKYYSDLDKDTKPEYPNIEYIENFSNIKYGKAYFVDDVIKGLKINITPIIKEEQNWFSYIMSFDYFKDIKLFDESCLQKLAGFQRFGCYVERESYIQSALFSNYWTKLVEVIGGVNFCKLDVKEIFSTNNNYGSTGQLKIKLNTDTYKNGVIYRTDYDSIESKYFSWTPSDELDNKGDPKINNASILYILHENGKWLKGCLKYKNKITDPDELYFHIDYIVDDDFHNGDLYKTLSTDKYLLFESNSINGYLGSKEIQDEAVLKALENYTTIATIDHDVMFGEYDASDITPVLKNSTTIEIETPLWYNIDSYGWYWKYYTEPTSGSTIIPESELYFCYYDHYGPETEREFKKVLFTNNDYSSAQDGTYLFDWQNTKLYRRQNSSWVYLNSDSEKKVTAYFSSVFLHCMKRDRIYKGIPKTMSYVHTSNTALPVGNYYIKDNFGNMYLFTTTQELNANDKVTYDAVKDPNWMKQIVDAQEITIDNLVMEQGSINENGDLIESMFKSRSEIFIDMESSDYIRSFTLSGFSSAFPLTIYKYNESKECLVNETSYDVSGYDGIFEISENVRYIKFTCDLDAKIFNDTYLNTFEIKSGNYSTLKTKILQFMNDGFVYNPNNILTSLSIPIGNSSEIGDYDVSNENLFISEATEVNSFKNAEGNLEYGTYPITNSGYLDDEGSIVADDDWCKSMAFFQVFPTLKYQIINGNYNTQNNSYEIEYNIHLYDSKKKHKGIIVSSIDGNKLYGDYNSSNPNNNKFIIPEDIYYIKFCCKDPGSNSDWFKIFNEHISTVININAVDKNNCIIYLPDVPYYELTNVEKDEENDGIISYIKELNELCDDVYINKYENFQYVQDILKKLEESFSIKLEDLYREGWWQKNDYVDGDEDKLYIDAIDSLKKISKPEVSYQIDYLDLYGLKSIEDYYSNSLTSNVTWPDLTIAYAAHLIDTELGINCWAYFDKIQKCYDKPYQTKININTNLTTISQHSFTDVFTNIANVATQIKGKEAVIDKASNLSDSGEMNVSNLKRAVKNIDSNGIELFDGTIFNWSTIKDFLNNA